MAYKNDANSRFAEHPALTAPVKAPGQAPRAAEKPPVLKESADTIINGGWKYNPKQNIIEYSGHTVCAPKTPKVPHLELLIRLIKGEEVSSENDLRACIDLIVELRGQELSERVIRSSDDFKKALSIFPDFIVDIYERNKRSRRGAKAHAELYEFLESQANKESFLIRRAVEAFLRSTCDKPRVHIVRKPRSSGGQHPPQYPAPSDDDAHSPSPHKR